MSVVEGKRDARVPFALAAIWLVCTAINAGKAAHVDDTAHLEIARWIQQSPTHPMQGLVDWEGRAAPISELNQPHGFFYLVAALGSLTGDLLAAGQAWVACFLALGIVLFHRLWREVVGERGAVLGPALLFLGPAFLPGQNAMTDAPLTCLWIAFLYFLVRAEGPRTTRNLALASLVLSVALLVKYTSLALLPVLALDVLARGPTRRRSLAWLGVPLACLVAWSAFNVWDYGRVHLFDRPVGAQHLGPTLGGIVGRAVLFLIALGGVAPFALALVPLASRRVLAMGAATITIGAVGTQVVSNFVPVIAGESVATSAARVLFLLVGAVLVHLCWRTWRPSFAGLRGGITGTREPFSARDRRTITIAAYAIAGATFVIALAPFMAVRHVLLVLPAILLTLAAAYADRVAASPAWLRAGAIATVLVGVLLGVSDRRWAESYREAADRFGADRTASRQLFVGHWGWQWHAANAGLVRYEPGATELQQGDRVVRPQLISQPALAPADAARLEPAAPYVVEATPLDWVRTMTVRKGYYLVGEELPWTISTAPVEVFEVSTVRPGDAR